MGIRDYFERTSVCLIEWPDKAQGLLPEADIRIALSYSQNSRTVVIESSVLSQDELDRIASCFR